MTVLFTAIPGLVALLVCIRRGPERALIDVYLPVLLLLPAASYHWSISGQLNLSDTTIAPIAAFVIARYWRAWNWSFTDLLVIGYLVLSIMSGYIDKGFAEAHNLAIQMSCSTIFPYVVAKGIRPREDFFVAIAKRVVVCVSIVAIINVWEFRMGRDLFDTVFTPLFPGQVSSNWQGRMGFNRTSGPYVHPILAGIIFAVAYRLNQWLHQGRYWPDRVLGFPLSWTRACQFWLIVGAVMTLSRGPWIGAAAAALVVWVGRSRKRAQAIILMAFILVAVGAPLYQAANSYLSATSFQSVGEMQQSADYRREMNQKYIAVVEERPAWGWGRNNYPVIGGMASIDNHYLLLALDFGELVLGVFVVMLVWMVGRLILFCALHNAFTYQGSLALAFLGIYLLIIVSITTVYLGGQTFQIMFLLSGWSEILLLAPILAAATKVQPAKIANFKFQRVMA